MKLAKRLVPLLFVLPFFSCGDLEQKVMFTQTNTEDTVVITRREFRKGPLNTERELVAKYYSDNPDNKYINHEYYPLLEIRVRFPLNREKPVTEYFDDRHGIPGIPIVDAYWDGEKWIQRNQENEIEFLQHDKNFLEYKALLEVDERVNKH